MDGAQTKPFEPEHLGFVELRNVDFGEAGLTVFELRNHPSVDGTPDFLRLNVYLSKDGSFVTIWSGLLEPLFAESRLPATAYPPDFDFRDAYNVQLFQGFIEYQDEGAVILRALRIDEQPLPQALSAPGGVLHCRRLD